MSAKLNVKEAIQEIKRLEKTPDKKKILQYAAKRFQLLMSKHANVDSGKYIDSWKPKITGDRLVITTPQGQLFMWLEFTGTVPHTIVPKGPGYPLHWIDKETGGHRFAMKVRHPGTKPTPHVQKIMRILLKEIQQYYYDMARKELGWIR